MLKKSVFKTPVLRKLHKNEKVLCKKVNLVLLRKRKKATVAILPDFVSYDKKSRPLLLYVHIVDKIERDHGKILLENLIINANNWDYVIKNVDRNKDKINLIKLIPESNNLLIIAANRDNGFYLVTHYEIITKNPNKLKNLLQNRGDSLGATGGAAVPSSATSPEGAAIQLDLSGVSS